MIDVWMAMAEHFLDTETRQEIPFTALRCVEEGLTVEQARDVWRYEVSPAVSFNLWDVAGEWAGWDPDWLAERIQKRQVRPSWKARIAYRVSAHINNGVCEGILRCMTVLQDLGSQEDRLQRVRDLTFLARHAFDFVPAALAADAAVRIRAVYPRPFWSVFDSVVLSGERREAENRLRAALYG